MEEIDGKTFLVTRIHLLVTRDVELRGVKWNTVNEMNWWEDRKKWNNFLYNIKLILCRMEARNDNDDDYMGRKPAII